MKFNFPQGINLKFESILYFFLLMKRALIFSLFTFTFLYSQTPPVKVVNLIRGGDMEVVSVDANPWDGVSSGGLRVFTGQGSIVNSQGQVSGNAFPPSVQAVDLNGDGAKDFFVADSAGYFWIFLNKGTAKEPKFSRGELLPFWLPGVRIPKIQLVDFSGDGLLDLVIGDFVGKLYLVRNMGAANAPKFVTLTELKEYEVNTNAKGKLWCNYLAPCYFDWNGDGKKDLIMGEGSFSANSIFLLINNGTNEKPNFNAPKQMITSQGREHLVPLIFDWNQDGKPDLVFGEREKGQISVSLHKETLPMNDPMTIRFGSTGATTTLANPCFEDMNDDGLPDLIIGSTSGNLRIAYNKGSKGANVFDKVENIKGESTLPNVLRSVAWVSEVPGGISSPEGARFFLLKALSKKERYKTQKNLIGYEPELELPQGSVGDSCLFFEFIDTKQEFIKEVPRFITESGGKTFGLNYPDSILLKSDTEYELSFFVKGNGFGDCQVSLTGSSSFLEKKGNEERYAGEGLNAIAQSNFNVNSSWSQQKKKVRYTKTKGDKKEPEEFRLAFTFIGEGSFYMDDVVLVEKK